MFSLKRTVFILSIAMLSAATVKLAAQDAAPSDAQPASEAQETKEESGSLIRRGVASLKKGAADSIAMDRMRTVRLMENMIHRSFLAGWTKSAGM